MAPPEEYDRTAEALADTPLFGKLPAIAVAALLQEVEVRRYKAGEIVFRSGDPGSHLFVVAEGAVRVFLTSPRGNEMSLAVLRPNETFGELAILDHGDRSASVETISDSVLLAFSRERIYRALRDQPLLMEGMLASLGAALRRLTEQTGDFVFLDPHERAAKLLLGLIDERSEFVDGVPALDLRLTQSDVARVIGRSANTVNDILQAFEKLGCIEIGGGWLKVVSRELLERQAGQGLSWAELANRAFHDPLTKLANRGLFVERVRAATQRMEETGELIAVLYIDLDGFKEINDRYGHGSGDELLTIVADRLRTSIRRPDTAARMGGDEFAVLLAELQSEVNADDVSKRISHALNSPYIIGNNRVRVGASMGIVTMSKENMIPIEELLVRADKAMYEAKRAGGGSHALRAS